MVEKHRRSILLPLECALWGTIPYCLGILGFFYNSLECFRVVHCEVGKHLTVDFDTGLVKQAHEFGIRKVFQTSSCVDTLNPKSAEVALFVLTIAVSIG